MSRAALQEAIPPGHLLGEKTQTVRLWPFRRTRAGQRSYIPGAGHILVEAVDEVALDDLNEADAALDGFASLAALRAELAALYPPDAAAGYRAYRIRFRLDANEPERGG